MESTDVLTEAFGRLQPLVKSACEGLTQDQLELRPDSDANSIGWLIWHLTRVQDDHVADLVHSKQIWIEQGWQEQFGLYLPADDIGYGHNSTDVAKVRGLSPEQLLGYYAQTQERTMSVLTGFTSVDLDHVIDDSWDPPVTTGARLVSVLGDCLEHVGQAAYLRGLVERGSTQ